MELPVRDLKTRQMESVTGSPLAVLSVEKVSRWDPDELQVIFRIAFWFVHGVFALALSVPKKLLNFCEHFRTIAWMNHMYVACVAAQPITESGLTL